MPTGAQPARGGADRGLALIRLVALPVILVGELVIEAPDETTGAFPVVFALTALYAVGALVLTYSGLRHVVAPVTYVALDLLFLAALSLASGGETSEVRRAFFLPPVAAAFLLRPALTALASAAAVAAYLGVSLVNPPAGEFADANFVAVQAGYIAWFGFAATVLSFTLAAGQRRIEELAADRGRLVAQAIEAEETERRRISEALHDEAVQNLLAARLDLPHAREGAADALSRIEEEIDRTLAQLRESVADLHPVGLQHGGLAGALNAAARRSEGRGGFRCSVRVDDAATGFCDELLLSLARELLANAAKHAEASRVSVVVERRGEELFLAVVDDGRGIPLGRPDAALHEGHIGLASSAERVKALSGRFEIDSTPGRGTAVRVSIPTSACELTSPKRAEAHVP